MHPDNEPRKKHQDNESARWRRLCSKCNNVVFYSVAEQAALRREDGMSGAIGRELTAGTIKFVFLVFIK